MPAPLIAALAPVLAPKLIDMIDGWLKRAVPDPLEQERQALKFIEILHESDTAQIEVNKIEAANPKRSWREGAGWVCVVAMGYQYILAPLASWGLAAFGHPIPNPPTLDSVLWELLFGMLGLGALKSVDKKFANGG